MLSMLKKFTLLSTIVLWVSTIISCETKTDENRLQNLRFEFEEYTVEQIHEGYLTGKFTVEDVVVAFLQRIEQIDTKGPGLNSVIVVNPDALSIARLQDKHLKDGGEISPLFGIPVLLKDNIDTHDKMPTTAGSRALMESYPLQDSWVTHKLREAGAVILGKTNLSEWANFRGELSSSGWSGVGGQTHNPYDLDRNPCGSSSGSGVAVSANLCVIAIGTETNGSIVCPSTANGIVGIKPTVGLVSRTGIIPISYSQDTAGPMARTVRDATICLGTLIGQDPEDAKTQESSGKVHTDYTKYLNADGLKGKRIGYYPEPLGEHFKVRQVMEEAVDFLKSNDVEIVKLDRVFDPEAHAASFQVMLFEYKAGLNAYFESLGEDAAIKNLDELIAFNEQDELELSFYNQEYLIQANAKSDLNSKEYLEALDKMHRLTREEGIDKVMDEHNLDAIIAPTGAPAWLTDHTNGDAYIMGSSSAAAISGYPNITVPMGNVDGLPVGMSIFGRAWSEPVLIEIAYAYEQGTQHRRVPSFKKN
jgi:amidase